MIKLLIDGYNVLAPVAGPGRRPDPAWLHRERMMLLDRLAHRLPGDVLPAVCVVFDANNPPPDRPNQFDHHQMAVHFAVEYVEADDLIEELINAHSAPKKLAVVSSDRRIQAAAKRRGAESFESAEWLDDLMDGRPRLAKASRKRPRQPGSGTASDSGAGQGDKKIHGDVDVDMWMEEFGFDAKDG